MTSRVLHTLWLRWLVKESILVLFWYPVMAVHVITTETMSSQRLNVSLHSSLNNTYLFTYWRAPVCQDKHVEIIESSGSFLLSWGFWESTPGCRAWQQVHLPAEPSYWTWPFSLILGNASSAVEQWDLNCCMYLNLIIRTFCICLSFSNQLKHTTWSAQM